MEREAPSRPSVDRARRRRPGRCSVSPAPASAHANLAELRPGGQRAARAGARRGHDDVHRAARPEAVARPRAGRERRDRSRRVRSRRCPGTTTSSGSRSPRICPTASTRSAGASSPRRTGMRRRARSASASTWRPGTVVTPSVPVHDDPVALGGQRRRQALLYVGLALVFAAAVGRDLRVRRRRARAPTGASIAAPRRPSLGGVVMLVAERATLGVSMGDLLSSATGKDYLWLLGGVTFAGVAAVDAARRSDRTLARRRRGRGGGGHADPRDAAVTPPPRRPRRSRSACSGSTSWPRACGSAASRWRSCGPSAPALGGTTPRSIRCAAYSSLAGYALAVVLFTGVLRATQEVGGALEARGPVPTARTTRRSSSRSSLVVAVDRTGRGQPVPLDPADGRAPRSPPADHGDRVGRRRRRVLR